MEGRQRWHPWRSRCTPPQAPSHTTKKTLTEAVFAIVAASTPHPYRPPPPPPHLSPPWLGVIVDPRPALHWRGPGSTRPVLRCGGAQAHAQAPLRRPGARPARSSAPPAGGPWHRRAAAARARALLRRGCRWRSPTLAKAFVDTDLGTAAALDAPDLVAVSLSWMNPMATDLMFLS